jgi:glycosyltransferase involved in cell wall biosynthesis
VAPRTGKDVAGARPGSTGAALAFVQGAADADGAAPAPSADGPRVLSLVDYYLPGYRAGGPLRTLGNVAAHLGAEFRFTMVTRDRDLGDAAPYPGLPPDGRRTVGGARVVYLPPGARGMRALERVVRAERPEVLWLNSLFSPAFTLRPLLLRRAGRLGAVPVILAPRGELSPGALAIKAARKRAYLRATRAAGLYRGVIWQASAEAEAEDIRRCFGRSVRLVVAPDLAAPVPAAPPPARAKAPGTLRVAFLSRVSRKKNLDGALALLRGAGPGIRFDVYGPEEDAAYAAECRARAASLAPEVEVRFHGAVTPEQVPARLAESHLFFLPTHGENFGHVVLEALLAGCVLLLSDQTPWSGLRERGVGWDLPLTRPDLFRDALRSCVAMDDAEFRARSLAARRMGEAYATDPAVVEGTRRMLLDAARENASAAAR